MAERAGDVVLVITGVGDTHADAVITELRSRRVSVFRLHTAELPRALTITLELGSDGLVGELRKPGRAVALHDVGAVWLRRPGDPVPHDGLHPRAHDYVVRQCEEMLAAMYAALPVLWVGEPQRLARAVIKPLQLARARALGLAVPETLVSNDPQRCAAFRESIRPRRCALKPLAWVAIEEDRGVERLPTTTVVEDGEDLAGAELAPSIFQTYVEKAFELRCVVIGEQVFSAAIHSQEDPRSRHDSRLGSARVAHYELPDAEAERLCALTASFGLNFASADLVVTPEGEHVFLELNPNGQWLWLERRLGLPLCGTLADLLCSELSRRPLAA